MRLGVIGLGLIGSRRLGIVRGLGHEVAFAVDPDPARREAHGDQTACIVGGVDDLAPGDLVGVEAAIVAVPHDLAGACCAWVLDHGWHVLCEKPLGLCHSQALAVADRARRAGLIVGAGFNYRYLPGVGDLERLLANGDLGALRRLRLSMGHGGRPGMEAEWKLRRARAGGGALIDPGVHLLDLARRLAGEPRVRAARLSRRFWASDVEDNCILELACGEVEVTIDVSLTSWKNAFVVEAHGDDGLAILTGRGGAYGPQRLEYVNRWFWNGDDRRRVVDYGEADPSFERETRAFLAAIRGDHDGRLSGPADGCAALAVVDAAYQQAAWATDGA